MQPWSMDDTPLLPILQQGDRPFPPSRLRWYPGAGSRGWKEHAGTDRGRRRRPDGDSALVSARATGNRRRASRARDGLRSALPRRGDDAVRNRRAGPDGTAAAPRVAAFTAARSLGVLLQRGSVSGAARARSRTPELRADHVAAASAARTRRGGAALPLVSLRAGDDGAGLLAAGGRGRGRSRRHSRRPT